ncbi:hypothetical protein P153DRAFT_336572 [Dothidotthia symphoricarpi CBS 119687]|uniref:Zn(2)-C6 fungal-type domain-containing protein n=1 Tax=Dothidotthia symphoricarpi CBS 119687 TaxID=1392245 RepID=A0A6A6AFQ8_9PLEO|nr:uncharacterized protein P153DRAFT_336572 [Dothidotthia symphoricarpi CBS 119687]KAF2130739.1 hypothetical protein P153DRAFT_336572 [Dothidotthia symphoricarpi CBS 119687]
MVDNDMPPRPETEFDFSLPHGLEAGEDASNDDQNDRDSLHDLFNSPEPDNDNEHNKIDHNDHDLNPENRNNDQQDLNYCAFAKGFSDDEDGDETFDGSWAGHQAKTSSSRNKKSPRRSETDDADDEESPRMKKPRQSLFGGPDEEVEEDEPDRRVTEDQSGLDALDTPEQGIRNRISSLNLDQQEDETIRPFNLGFGLASSDRGSISPRSSPAPSEGSVIIPPDDQVPYELRKNIDRKKTTTYLDTDQTGNYDPLQEVKQKMRALNKARTAKRGKKKGKERVPKLRIRKRIIKFHFEVFGNVLNLTNEEDNWPDNWSELDSEYEREAQELRSFYRRNTPGVVQQVPIVDPAGLLQDLTGHPAARGCVSCRLNEQTCSMSEDGPYPCSRCIDDRTECEPISPPTVKGRCKRCRKDNQESCSFEDNPDQALCDYCAENEFICEALPPEGYKADRVSLDAVLYSSNRPHATCTSCRQQKKRCSLKKKHHKPPCKQCKKDGTGCTFYDLPKQDDWRKKPGKIAPEVSTPGSQFFTPEDLADLMMRDEEMPSRAVTPDIEMEDDAGRKGRLGKINTSFAHPILFNEVAFDETAQQPSDCNFCELPIFGMIGHFEREVHVIQWYNGLGYTEVGGGHCSDKGPTTMCVSCTTSRLQILACPAHQLTPIRHTNEHPSFDDVAEELMFAEPGSIAMQYQLQRWCSMCFSVATFGCACSQPSVCGEEETELSGCGLRLCDSCEIALRGFAGDFDRMAEDMDRQSKIAEFDQQQGRSLEGVARADVGFLRQDGLLMRHIGGEDGED